MHSECVWFIPRVETAVMVTTVTLFNHKVMKGKRNREKRLLYGLTELGWAPKFVGVSFDQSSAKGMAYQTANLM